MNKLTIVIVLLLIVMACQKKAVPVITDRKTEPFKGVTTTPSSVAIKPDTAIGKTVFVNRCGRCHSLYEPAQFNEKRWDAILLSMIPKARLTDEQGIHVTAYIKANAAK